MTKRLAAFIFFSYICLPRTPHCPLLTNTMAALAIGAPPGMTLRRGNMADLNTLVELGLAAMPMDPQWNYRHPHRAEYPDEHRDGTAERWQRFFKSDVYGEWAVYLVDYQEQEDSLPTEQAHQDEQALVGDAARAISFSVWHFPPSHILESQYMQKEDSGEQSLPLTAIFCKCSHKWHSR
jgi:hypothetical protein